MSTSASESEDGTELVAPMAEPDGGALSIPSADGYHYADDHPWGESDQAKLTDDMWDAVESFPESGSEVPAYSAPKISKRATS